MSTLSLRAGRNHFEVLLTRCVLKELEGCRAERFQPYRSRLTNCRKRPLQTADPQGNGQPNITKPPSSATLAGTRQHVGDAFPRPRLEGGTTPQSRMCPHALQPMPDAIIETALRLCKADYVRI